MWSRGIGVGRAGTLAGRLLLMAVSFAPEAARRKKWSASLLGNALRQAIRSLEPFVTAAHRQAEPAPAEN
jgi:hypothetical protein